MGFYDNIAAIQARDLVLDWPKGANSSDTVLSGVHFNLTALKYWNYTYYANNTVSNNSKCYLTFAPYQADYVFGNGSFTNATKCYTAVKNIGVRGNVGIGFACFFGLMLMLLLTVLAKHGKMYLPRERRFYPIGRRWQWYWGIFVCAAALISLFTNIDVDRYYLTELPITLTVFFWFLMCMGTTAQTWEAVRHWGSWQERQFVDPNPFIYSEDDRRAKIEFWLPLWFYFLVWMVSLSISLVRVASPATPTPHMIDFKKLTPECRTSSLSSLEAGVSLKSSTLPSRLRPLPSPPPPASVSRPLPSSCSPRG